MKGIGMDTGLRLSAAAAAAIGAGGRRRPGRCGAGRRDAPLVRSCAAALLARSAAVSPASAQSRGELLYATHCVASRTTEMHRRGKRAVSGWTSPKWPGRPASLGWNDGDIPDVTRCPDEDSCRFDQTADPVSFRGLREGLAGLAPSRRLAAAGRPIDAGSGRSLAGSGRGS